MDLSTVITALLSSGVISLGTAKYLTTRLLDHRLAKDLKDHQEGLDEKLARSKAELDSRLAKAKAEVEATLRRGVEEYLGDKAAERQYRLDAQKRLYTAIGPLRFQLVTACVEFAGRVERIGGGEQYASSVKGYFGQSTVFRLVRLFAITELIERQVAYADFSVDPSTADLLRFKRRAFLCLSSSRISLDHPQADWSRQVEHVFSDKLSMVAAAAIVTDGDPARARAMRFDEFIAFIGDPRNLEALQPIPRLLDGFTIGSKPILWIRLVALAHLCNAFAAQEGPHIGITPEPFDGSRMLRVSGDAFLMTHIDRYRRMLDDLLRYPVN
jgi:hypothetical protein